MCKAITELIEGGKQEGGQEERKNTERESTRADAATLNLFTIFAIMSRWVY